MTKEGIPKIAGIVCWTILGLAISSFTGYFLGARYQPESFLGTPDYFLSVLDVRLERFDRAKPPRIVILGGSYAEFMGEDAGVYNLSIAAGHPQEDYMIVKRYCAPDDIAIHVLALRDLIELHHSPRWYAASTFWRRVYLSRLFLQKQLGIAPDPKFRRSPSLFELQSLRCAIGGRTVPYFRGLLDQVTRFAEAAYKRPISLDLLKKLRACHPNILFVIHPTLPLRRIDGNMKLANEIASVIDAQEEMKQLLEASDLPCLDLSNTIQFDEYVDLLHVMPSTSRKLLRTIQVYMASQNSNSIHG
ncbi:hypothetical protein HZA56_09670 [Candidatus Poribacteria bacterium]|nr:hypothetical protein [Candidatus Poribacteria bacterium]